MSNPNTQRVIKGHELFSNYLDEERTIKVLLPPGYASDTNHSRRYPVLYCHDGNEFFTHGRIATLATQLMETGELSPLFIVALAVNMKQRTADYATFGERHQKYVQFVMQEAVPFIESTYRIAPEPEHQFMAGISLGAMTTLSLHLQYPEKFKRLLLFSGAYYEEQQNHVQQIQRLNDLKTYMVVGRQETAVDTHNGKSDFYDLNLKMRDLLRLRGAEVDYHEADGTHIWGFWQSLIPSSLRWLEGHLSQ
ncbi:esterase family protein [Alicyclobacillus sp. SO9]|uniref:alpha/beta hydrolase n=1 Tax=Alicyclobacillus sp. SO9 TaxID=2665646 RepID=UPI0018E783A6|nr:alpha/beta hydrolase-fold protein [Alicyclobacillus sp. SO9]QQE79614.1 esterase family protein [Alicyclobacillus sp. SO9]